MNRFVSGMVLLIVCLLLNLSGPSFLINSAHAEVVYVPEALEPWRDWVLQDHKELDCPIAWAKNARGNNLGRECIWSNRLDVNVLAKSISFQQDWQIYKDVWVTLPGNDALWPSGVSVNGKPASISRRGGKPAVFLMKGEHDVKGLIPFKRRPSSIPLPIQSGIVTLTIDGKSIDRPNLQRNNILLRDSSPKLDARELNDSLSMRVYRKVTDGSPIIITTRLELSVSGRDREVSLGRYTPGGEPVRFMAQLPARIEADGRLRVQVTAGEWDLTLTTRHSEREPSFEMARLSESWPTQEIWSYLPDRDFRSTKVKGATSIDPSQAGVPSEWEHLPAYLVDETTGLSIEELSNVAEGDAISDLALTKVIWLDFDGEGLTVQDRFSGEVNRTTRMTAVGGYELGRVSLNGAPQLITRMPEENDGVELREGRLNLETVSRIDLGSIDNPGAIGWQSSVQNLNASLHTPPGWLLLHVGGPDKATQTWLSKWNLWAIFLLLLITGALWRTTGAVGGILALATLFLTYHDDYSLGLILLVFAIFLAISQLRLKGSAHRYIVLLRNMVMLGIMLTSVAYIVNEVRMGMYPQLARQGDIYDPGGYLRSGKMSARMNSSRFEPEVALMASPEDELDADVMQDDIDRSTAKRDMRRVREAQASQEMQLEEVVVTGERVQSKYGANENVQTGPGIPGWTWHSAQLLWSGPVLVDQNFAIYALSPSEHRLLRLVKIAFLLLLVLKLAASCYNFRTPPFLGQKPLNDKPDATGRKNTGTGMEAVRATAVVLLTSMAASLFSPDSIAATPDIAILNELERRLTELPNCAPTCASMRSVSIQVNKSELEVNVVVDADALTSFPLPIAGLGWTPQQIEVVGQRAVTRKVGNSFHVALDAGQTIVRLKGPVIGDELQIRFPVQAHNVEVTAPGWKITGRDGTGLRGDLLQLTKIEANDQKIDENNLLPDPMKPYFRVIRRLNIENDWTVSTRVQRVAPETGSINFQIPLIDGESVITPGVSVSDNRVEGTIPNGQSMFRWESKLSKTPELKLVAADIERWVETWRVWTSPRWHMETSGLSVVQDSSDLPTWKPWSGDSVVLTLTRPEPAEGAVQTIQELRLTHQPGQRSAIHRLGIKVTASQAAEFPIALPKGAIVKEIIVDGELQQYAGGENLKVPLHPGEQDINLRWESNTGIKILEQTPVPVFEGDISNIIINMKVPDDRWPLLVGGPSIGPALLFWGVVVAIVLVGSLLGQIPILPVKGWEWILLGVGMSTISFPGSLVVVCWFLAMAARNEVGIATSRLRHNIMQVFLVLLTVVALYNLLSIIPESLLSSPDMQIIGNGSHTGNLIWYQDRATGELPVGWLFSLPMWSYRLAMLLWSIWIVFAMLRWARWGWSAYSSGSIWIGATGTLLAGDEEHGNDQHKDGN